MELLHRDGVLAVKGIVDPAHVVAIRDSMTATAQAVAASKDAGKITQFNQGVATNFLMSPPLSDESLLFEDVYANRFVHELASAYLGPGIKVHLLTGNCAMPRTKERQAVHRDLPWIAPEAPFILNANMCLSGPSSPSLPRPPQPDPADAAARRLLPAHGLDRGLVRHAHDERPVPALPLGRRASPALRRRAAARRGSSAGAAWRTSRRRGGDGAAARLEDLVRRSCARGRGERTSQHD